LLPKAGPELQSSRVAEISTSPPRWAVRRESFSIGPAAAAQFGDDLPKAYGIVWEDDLFAPPGEDSRYTTRNPRACALGPDDLASIPHRRARLEAAYGPRMRRLRQEIGQLERLKTLLTAV